MKNARNCLKFIHGVAPTQLKSYLFFYLLRNLARSRLFYNKFIGIRSGALLVITCVCLVYVCVEWRTRQSTPYNVIHTIFEYDFFFRFNLNAHFSFEHLINAPWVTNIFSLIRCSHLNYIVERKRLLNSWNACFTYTRSRSLAHSAAC